MTRFAQLLPHDAQNKRVGLHLRVVRHEVAMAGGVALVPDIEELVKRHAYRAGARDAGRALNDERQGVVMDEADDAQCYLRIEEFRHFMFAPDLVPICAVVEGQAQKVVVWTHPRRHGERDVIAIRGANGNHAASREQFQPLALRLPFQKLTVNHVYFHGPDEVALAWLHQSQRGGTCSRTFV